MFIRNFKNNGIKMPVGKNDIVSVLWIIFMFVSVLLKYTEKNICFWM